MIENCVDRRFSNRLILLSEYDNIMKEQANLNSIEPVIDYQMNKTHYLPHRSVVKENRQTTKVRMSSSQVAKEDLNNRLMIL